MNLRQIASQLTAQLELMQGREKGNTEALLNTPVTINDFDYLEGDDGTYAVFTIKEDTQQFYFGNSILTGHLQELEAKGFKNAVQGEGLPTLFEQKRSKQNRTYTKVTFYPEG